MTKQRLGGIVWTARNTMGDVRLVVRWEDDTGWLAITDWARFRVDIPPRDVRRLMRLMQRALDWRYGKRADALGCEEHKERGKHEPVA